jgi:hypothetical protein
VAQLRVDIVGRLNHRAEARLEFTCLLNHAHISAGLPLQIVADSARLAPSYLSELLAGDKHRTGLHRLRILCEDGWQLSEGATLRILSARVRLDRQLSDRLPAEFYWRLARFCSLDAFARAVHLHRSTIRRFVTQAYVPAFDVTSAICRGLGFDRRSIKSIYLGLLTQAATVDAIDDTRLINMPAPQDAAPV